MFVIGVLCLVATSFAFPYEAAPGADIKVPETDLHTNLPESIKVSEAKKEEVKHINGNEAKINVLVAPREPSAQETVIKTIPETELHTNLPEDIKLSGAIKEEVQHIKENEVKVNVLVNPRETSAQKTIVEKMPETNLHTNIPEPIEVFEGNKKDAKESEAKINVLAAPRELSTPEIIVKTIPGTDLHTNVPETIRVSVKEENVKDIKEDKSKVNVLAVPREVIAPKVIKTIPKANLRTNLSKDIKVSEVKKEEVKEIKEDEAKVNRLAGSHKTSTSEDVTVPETLHINAPEPNGVTKEDEPKMIVLASLPEPPKLPPMHKSIREYLNGEIKDHHKIKTSTPNIRFRKAPIVRILNIYS